MSSRRCRTAAAFSSYSAMGRSCTRRQRVRSTSRNCPPPGSTSAATRRSGANRERRSTSQTAAASPSARVGQRPTTSRPPLRRQPLDGRDDRGRVDDEQVRRPGDDRLDRSLLGVAGAVREPLGTRRRLLALGGGAAVDARAAVGVDGRVRVDRLVAQPASPTVAFADLVKGAHGPETTALPSVDGFRGHPGGVLPVHGPVLRAARRAVRRGAGDPCRCTGARRRLRTRSPDRPARRAPGRRCRHRRRPLRVVRRGGTRPVPRPAGAGRRRRVAAAARRLRRPDGRPSSSSTS